VVEEKFIMILDKHHITLYVVAIAFAMILTYSIADSLAARKQAKDEQALAVLQAESKVKDQQNVLFQQQMAQITQQLTNTNLQLQADKVAQQKQIQVLQGELANRKQQDATLPPDQLAKHMGDLVTGVLPTIITPKEQISNLSAVDVYLFTQDEVVKVEQALEEPPVLKQQIAADEVIITKDTAIIANDATILDTEKKSHGSDVTALQAKLDAANGQIKVEKDKARHGKLKWFGIGYVAGFGSAIVLKAFVPIFTL
jgi:hypothetical protein